MKKILAILAVSSLLTGCGYLNEEFSCNETATDSCLTIDKVNAMTESRDSNESVTTISKKSLPTHSQEVVWIASNKGES